MDILIFIVSGTLAAATALIFAAMGALVAEKSGVLNLGIEGMMATGAAMGFVMTSLSGSHALGFLSGAILGMLL
ncbi:MAG: ABC transporter permease, partial [Pseudomonadota bacterium]